jgi:hypothetical protein
MHPRSSVRSTFARYRRPQYELDRVPEGAFDAFHLEGELPMNARAHLKADFDGPEDRQLADDIARAMHHRPLMKRLARVDASRHDATVVLAKATDEGAPAPSPVEADIPPSITDPRSIEEIIDDLGQVTGTPPSAEWLDNARRAHRQARVSHAMAWVTTLAIAMSIIGTALLLLRA